MSEQDFPIWTRYWPRIKPRTLALYFDVGLGLPDQIPKTEDAAQLLGWIRNTQKRADVIAERERDLLLIELRFNAQMNAIGRLAGYRKLLEQDNPFKKLVIPILVTNKIDTEVRSLAQDFEIIYEIV